MNEPLPPGVEPAADLLDIPGVGSFFLLPDPAAPADRYAVCMFILARAGAAWIDIAPDEVGPLLRARSWIEAEAIVARRRPSSPTS